MPKKKSYNLAETEYSNYISDKLSGSIVKDVLNPVFGARHWGKRFPIFTLYIR
jgi:hypothetical protein